MIEQAESSKFPIQYMDTIGAIEMAARRMGITPKQYAKRSKILAKDEEERRLMAMDTNKSKAMSPQEKEDALNAFSRRRFLELGIGAIPGEGSIFHT